MARDEIPQILSLPLQERGPALCAAHENQWYERKAFAADPKVIAKAIVGMANAEGGTLVIGIRDRAVENSADAIKKINALRQVPLNMIAPPLATDIQEIPVTTREGQPSTLLIFTIPPSNSAHKTHDGKAFLRAGDSTIELTQSQWEELFYERSPQAYEAERVDLDISDLNDELLEEFRTRIGSTQDAEGLLRTRGLVTRDGALTIAGTLLFARHPEALFPQAHIRVLRYLEDDPGYGERQNLFAEGDRRIEGPLVHQLREALSLINQWIPRRQALNADGTFGPHTPSIPQSVWQEAVVNAVTHRSYSAAGDHIRVSIFPHRIEVSSPGRFPGLINPHNVDTPLDIVRYARNPRIARVLADFNITQELGEGIRRMVYDMRHAGLNDPNFRQNAGGVRVIMDASARLSEELLRQLPPQAGDIVMLLRHSGALGTGEITDRLGIARPTALRSLNALRDHGIVERVGKSPTDPRAVWCISGTENRS